MKMFAVDSQYQRGRGGEEVPRGEAGPVGRGRSTWEGGDGDQIPKAVGARDNQVERKQGDSQLCVLEGDSCRREEDGWIAWGRREQGRPG